MKNKRIIISIIILWSIGPFLWQLYTSFSTNSAILSAGEWGSQRWTLENYFNLIYSDPPFYKYLLNSFILGILSTILTLFLSLPAAYTIARIKEKVSNIFKILYLAAALLPYFLLFLSLLEIARDYNLGNNIYALSIPYAGLSLPLSVLLLTAAFKDIPKELEEVSILEGFNVFQRLKWILLPLISPATASTAIIVFLFSWNEYPIALTWLTKSDIITLPVAIARIAGSSIFTVPYGTYAAATVLGSVPLLLIVLIFQRQIISGLTQGAIKG